MERLDARHARRRRRPCQLGRVGEAAHREEVVPIRVHRVRAVALVADRLGEEAPEDLATRLLVGLRHAGGARRGDPVDGLRHDRPERVHEADVVGEAIVRGEGVDELAVAVVLRGRVGAAAIDAAGHAAVGELVGRIPGEEASHLVHVPGLQHRVGGERAVADPRARVGARAGLDRGAVAVDQDVRDRRAERVDESRGDLRQRQLDTAHALGPVPDDARPLGLDLGGRRGVGADHRRSGIVKRHGDVDDAVRAGLDAQTVPERSRRPAERVGDHEMDLERQASLRRKVRPALLEARGAEPVEGRERDDRALVVHPHGAGVEAEQANRRHPPTMLSDCHGGSTWNGRSARKRSTSRVRCPRFSRS